MLAPASEGIVCYTQPQWVPVSIMLSFRMFWHSSGENYAWDFPLFSLTEVMIGIPLIGDTRSFLSHYTLL